MCPNDPRHGSPRRRLRPGVEGLETRDLPSGATLAVVPAITRVSHGTAATHTLGDTSGTASADSTAKDPGRPANLFGKGPLQPFLNPNVISQAAVALYGNPPTPAAPNPNYPTPAEIKREEFTATAIGHYVVGPPTFSDRSERIYAYGRASTSSAWLQSKWQVVLYPPANPAATPTPGDPYANQVTGLAVFITQNYLQSGSALILDLNETVSPGSSPTALPTHGTWTVDTTSAGAFTTPLGFTQGTGTFDVRYIPDPHPEPGTMGSGTVVFQFQGLYNFSQLISAISKVYS